MAELLDRPKREQAFSRKLGALFAKHRRELERIAGYPPDPSKIPPEFWEKVEKDSRAALAAFLLLVFTDSAIQHGMKRTRAEGLAQEWADGRAAEIGRQFAGNTRSWVQDVGHADGALGPARAATIARTETTIARTAGIKGVNDDPETPILTDDGERVDPFDGKGGDGESERPRAGKAVLIWELEVIRSVEKSCKFCPIMAGTGEGVWGLYYPSGPSAHILCACGIRVAAPGTRTKTPRQSDAQIRQAARDSRVFGY